MSGLISSSIAVQIQLCPIKTHKGHLHISTPYLDAYCSIVTCSSLNDLFTFSSFPNKLYLFIFDHYLLFFHRFLFISQAQLSP